MRVKLADRVAYVTGKLRTLGFQSITLATYRPGPTSLDGYYRLQAVKRDFRAFISELILGGSIAKYSYTLLYNERAILRYDNAPHHPHIETFPHHKHEHDKVVPLPDHSVDAFIKEVKSLVKERPLT
ncbi:MAG: DUF6516 family protein [Desulfurococcales archaeon]|nr:DUF6516 family protein [Desulfurococcales archaeon]